MAIRVTPAEKRARLREVAAAYIAAHGLDSFNLHRLAPLAGIKFDLARHYYRTNAALIADIARHHHAALGERLADAILDSRALAPQQRLHYLAAAILDAFAEDADAQRATYAAVAALPRVAHAVRHTDRWLADELAEATGEPILARAALVLLNHWAAQLDPEDTETRAACARLLASRLTAPSARTDRRRPCRGR